MTCFDIDGGDEGERRKDGGEGHRGVVSNPRRGIKKRHFGERQAECTCRVGEDVGV
jgi:hypothetical protein